MQSLEDVLEYDNPHVVEKFASQHGLELSDSIDIFNETKRWLWFAANADIPSISIYPSMRVIDEMWHVFILFTHDYTEFCNKYFGRFLHHAPNVEGHGDPTDPAALKETIRCELNEMHRLLGERTMLKWFVSYRHTYGFHKTSSRVEKFETVGEALQTVDAQRLQPGLNSEGFLEALTAVQLPTKKCTCFGAGSPSCGPSKCVCNKTV